MRNYSAQTWNFCKGVSPFSLGDLLQYCTHPEPEIKYGCGVGVGGVACFHSESGVGFQNFWIFKKWRVGVDF